MRPGDLLMPHVSLRRTGLAAVDGGGEVLVEALDAAVGPAGTLLMVLGTYYPMDWVNHRPAEARAALLAGSAPCDPASAAALEEVGCFAEAFRRAPGTVVNANPSGRFGARGAQAKSLLRDGPWDDYYGPGSPLDRMAERGGRILRLGADRATVTALHLAEYLADVPNKRRTRWDYQLADGHRWVECLDDNEGIVDWHGEDYFALILDEYLSRGRGRRGRVGEADSELIEAADLIAFGARWMERNFR